MNLSKTPLYIIIFVILASLVAANSFEIDTKAKFDLGSYTNAFYNTTIRAVEPTANGATYTSRIFDAGGTTMNWFKLSWVSSGYGALPDNGATETQFVDRTINTTGNILLYHLDDVLTNGAKVKDSSGNNNNATFFTDNTNKTTTGKIANAINFDGYDYASLPAGLGPYNYTLSMWFKAGDTSNFPYLYKETLGGGLNINYLLLAFLDDGRLTTKYWYNDEQCILEINSTSAYNDSQWHHVAITREGITGKMYIDGRLKHTDTFTSAIGQPCEFHTTTSAKLGTLDGGIINTSNDFMGDIDEVSLWNRPLTASEISNMYIRGNTNLNLEARSCDDAICTGETYTDLSDVSPQNPNEINRYFQFRFTFETDLPQYKADLYNVTILYDSPPTVTMGGPADGTTTMNGSTTLSCTATDNNQVSTLTLYTNITGTMQANETVAGGNLSVTLNNLPDGAYAWNCLAVDNSTLSAWGTQKTFKSLFDTDLDGVPDVLDSLEGNEGWVVTSGISSLNITVEGASTYGTFTGMKEVLFYDSGTLLIGFNHDFSPSQEIDLSKVSITKGQTSLAFNLSGQLLPGESVTAYIQNNEIIKLCAADTPDLNNMTPDCTGTGETNLNACIGNSTGINVNGITCTDEGSRFAIGNITSIAVRGTLKNAPPPATSGSRGGGSGRAGNFRRNRGGGGGPTFDQSAAEVAAIASRMRGKRSFDNPRPAPQKTSSKNTVTDNKGNKLTGAVTGLGNFNWKAGLMIILALAILMAGSFGIRWHLKNKPKKPFDPFHDSLMDKIDRKFRRL